MSAIAAAISALVTALTAIGVFLQARASSEANVGQLFVSFSERYNEPEMAKALRELAKLYRSDEKGFAAAWVAGKRAQEAEALRLNECRRLVSRFYFDIARLYFRGLIDERVARELAENNGLNVFYHVCEPMNVANHPHRVERYSRALRRLCPQHGDGSVYESAPAAAAPQHAWWEKLLGLNRN